MLPYETYHVCQVMRSCAIGARDNYVGASPPSTALTPGGFTLLVLYCVWAGAQLAPQIFPVRVVWCGVTSREAYCAKCVQTDFLLALSPVESATESYVVHQNLAMVISPCLQLS